MTERKIPSNSARTWTRKDILTTFGAVLFMVSSLIWPDPVTAAERFETSSLARQDRGTDATELPAILSSADVARYRTLFAVQSAGAWGEADRVLDTVTDRVLLGHVLAQRYLHRAYKAQFAELRDWLERYADLPEAEAIHALALRRRPPGAGALARPRRDPIAVHGIGDAPADLRPPSHSAASMAATRAQLEIRSLAHTDPALAEQVLNTADAQHLFADDDYDAARADVAEGYLFQGDAHKTLLLAATTRTAAWRPLAHWDAGLAAWRLHRLGAARAHFETVARTPALSGWALSAAAFWAARVQTKAHRPALAEYWLKIAAQHPRTFYGLIAGRMLGISADFDFNRPLGTQIDLNAVTGIPATRRALALLQLGATEAAEFELRCLARDAPITLYPALVALAEQGSMPALAVQLGTVLGEADGTRHDDALYPLPGWRPPGGFNVDRALLFALVRQESQFMPAARSGAGALGIMQLMPATAEEMAAHLGLRLAPRGKTDPLLEPDINLALGQAFVGQLMADQQIGDNLILLAAAYNGGPGNLRRWAGQPDYQTDPLLFLESLPRRETRVFVERVLTNYWVYRLRLGQPTRGLDTLAAGGWPVYVALDAAPDQVANHVATR